MKQIYRKTQSTPTHSASQQTNGKEMNLSILSAEGFHIA